MPIKRILVPVDFSDVSLKALDYAVEFAARLGAEVVVVHAVEPASFMAPSEMYGSAINVGALLEAQEGAAREQLGKLAARLAKQKVKSRTVLRMGSAHQVVTEEAAKQKTDMIVMATHGRTGFSHMLLGSVAERVVRTSPCPVLTVRGSGPRKSPTRATKPKKAPTKRRAK